MAGKKKILIAEDEKPMAHALELKLNRSGYDAKTVFDGQQALEELEKNEYDLVLLDLMMPKKTGWTVLKELKHSENTKDIPVLVLTVYTDLEGIAKCTALGAKGYFIKSEYTLDEIIEKINEILI